MNRISIGNIEDIAAFVKAMQVNLYYDLPNNTKYSYIAIFEWLDIVEGKSNYTWKLIYKYKNSTDSEKVMPSAYGVTKYFKTEYGAKNNLIAYLKKYPL